jgi:uncharacterized protein YegL
MAMQDTNTSPKTLVYIVVDASAAMAGEKLQGVAQAIDAFAYQVGINPSADASVRFRVITFGDTITTGPLSSPKQLPAQSLAAQQKRSLGAVLTTLSQTIVADYTGGRRPLVFLLVSGNPTDDISGGVQSINTMEFAKRPRIILVNLDSSVALSFAKDVTIYSHDISPATRETIGAFFNNYVYMVVNAATGAITNHFKEVAHGGATPATKGVPQNMPIQNPPPGTSS